MDLYLKRAQIPIDAGQDWHGRRSIRVLQGATRVIPPWRVRYQILLRAEHEVPPWSVLLFMFLPPGRKLAHMVDATQVRGWGGVGMMTFLALAHMCDATQLMGGGGWGC